MYMLKTKFQDYLIIIHDIKCRFDTFEHILLLKLAL